MLEIGTKWLLDPITWISCETGQGAILLRLELPWRDEEVEGWVTDKDE